MENIYMKERNPLEELTFTVAEIRIAHEEMQVFNRSCTQSIYNLADFRIEDFIEFVEKSKLTKE